MEHNSSILKNQSSVFLTIEDYDEMRSLALMNEEAVEKRAQEIAKSREKKASLKVEFDTYSLHSSSKPYVCVDIEMAMHNDTEINDALTKASPIIYSWCEEHLKAYGKKMKSMRTTEKICVGQKKQIENLQHKYRKHRYYNVIFSGVIILLIIASLKEIVSSILNMF